jgi:hypothetical protein
MDEITSRTVELGLGGACKPGRTVTNVAMAQKKAPNFGAF